MVVGRRLTYGLRSQITRAATSVPSNIAEGWVRESSQEMVRFMSIAIGFVQAGLARVPADFDDVARVIGARPTTIIRTIHLPLVRPALSAAALLIFVDCLKEQPMTLLLRPLNVETLSTYIYQFATRGNFEEGSLAAILIVAVGILPVIRLVRLAETPHGMRPPVGQV